MSKYFLEVVEGANRFPRGASAGYPDLKTALREAKKYVDDALPRNYVRVYAVVGEARFGGDGVPYVRDLEDEE